MCIVHKKSNVKKLILLFALEILQLLVILNLNFSASKELPAIIK